METTSISQRKSGVYLIKCDKCKKNPADKQLFRLHRVNFLCTKCCLKWNKLFTKHNLAGIRRRDGGEAYFKAWDELFSVFIGQDKEKVIFI